MNGPLCPAGSAYDAKQKPVVLNRRTEDPGPAGRFYIRTHRFSRPRRARLGAKTAQRIIIDLKDKVAKGLPKSDILFELDNTIKIESLSALLALGFNKKGAEQKIDKVLKENPDISSVEELVKMALSQM